MTVSNEIIQVFEKIGEQFGIAIDWTSQNIIPYIQQISTKIVNYELITSWIWIAFAFIIFLTLAIIMFYCEKKYWWKNKEWRGMGITIGCIFLGLFLICIMVQLYDIIACYTFQEKIVLQWIKNSGLIK